MKLRLRKQNRNALIVWSFILFISFLIMSCGARRAEKKRSEESLKTELTDKIKIATSEEKTEVSETNIKKSVETTVSDQDQTTTKKEVIEPVDNTKPASYKDENGKLQELNNAKKTTETTTKNNNTKTEQLEKLEGFKKEGLSSNKKELAQNSIKLNIDAKKEAEAVNIDREAWSVWNFLWLLVLVPVYLVWKNKTKIAGWVAGLWWV